MHEAKRISTIPVVLLALLVLVLVGGAVAAERTGKINKGYGTAWTGLSAQERQLLDLANLASGAGGDSLRALRTCRCSCGQPCRTDADCGPGGICSAGITCCAKPTVSGVPVAEACRVIRKHRR